MSDLDRVYPARRRASALAVLVPRMRAINEALGRPKPGVYHSRQFGNRYKLSCIPDRDGSRKLYVRVDDKDTDAKVFSGWLGPRDADVHVMSWKRGDWERALLVSRSSER